MKEHQLTLFRFAFFVVLMWFIIICSIINSPHAALAPEKTVINFSSSQYNKLDFENVTYTTINKDGKEVFGIKWYGVDGVYSKEAPIVQGVHEFTFWLQNSSYFVEPAILVPDVSHKNQSVIANAIMLDTSNSSLSRISDLKNFYIDRNISYSCFNDAPEGTPKCSALLGFVYSGSYSKQLAPFGGIMQVESDNMNEMNCMISDGSLSLYRTYPTGNFMLSTLNILRTVHGGFTFYTIPKGFDGYTVSRHISCEFTKNTKHDLFDSVVSFKIIPNDFYIDKDKHLSLNIIDEQGNLLKNHSVETHAYFEVSQ